MAGDPSEFHEQKIPAAWARKGAGVCPGGGRRAHFGGEMFPWRKIAAAWARKGARACPGGDRRAHFGGEMFPWRGIAAAWARRGCQLWTEGAGRCWSARKGTGAHLGGEPGGTGRRRAGGGGNGSEGQEKRQHPRGSAALCWGGEEITPTRLLRLVLETYRSRRGSRLEPLQGFCL